MSYSELSGQTGLRFLAQGSGLTSDGARAGLHLRAASSALQKRAKNRQESLQDFVGNL